MFMFTQKTKNLLAQLGLVIVEDDRLPYDSGVLRFRDGKIGILVKEGFSMDERFEATFTIGFVTLYVPRHFTDNMTAVEDFHIDNSRKFHEDHTLEVVLRSSLYSDDHGPARLSTSQIFRRCDYEEFLKWQKTGVFSYIS